MAPAGRNAHKHVATGPRAGSQDHARPTPRHKAVRRRRIARVAGPAVFALSAAGTLFAIEAGDAGADLETNPAAVVPMELSLRTAEVSRSISRAVSRSAVRPLATAKPVVLRPTPVDHKWTTREVTLRTSANPKAHPTRTVPRWTRLGVTGETYRGWSEVVVEREVPVAGPKGKRGPTRTVTVARWVDGEYLAARKPAPPEPEPEPEPEAEPESTTEETATTSSGVSGAPCPDGSTIESGITSSAIRVYRAVCAAFPALTTYGGYDAHGEHIDGRAIDFMTDSALGQAVADYLLANAGTLGVRDIIWAQHIWTPEQSSSGWRPMEDRGSPTANHYDHVHVAVF
jgi:hypothetical protein